MSAIGIESEVAEVEEGETALDATVTLAFAFDVGYEIDLDRARGLIPVETGPLARRRRTPESIRYRPAPLRMALDVSGLTLPAGGSARVGPPRGELTFFDFGALSVVIEFPVESDPAGLLDLAGGLADPTPLTQAARLAIAPWLERIRPMVTEFAVSDLTEEYVVFQVRGVDGPWLARHTAWIAGLVRLEPGPLSPGEVREATRLGISYTPDDLVLLDWAAGFIADRDCVDTIQVIEFANLQLLEFRHIDDRLDDRLEDAYRRIHLDTAGKASRRSPLRGDVVRLIREMEIEATSLFERADNNLKLIGDQYLSRVFDLARTRFHLGEWQQSIRRKLDTVGSVYDLMANQANHSRGEFLEILVVILIAVEIVVAFIRH